MNETSLTILYYIVFISTFFSIAVISRHQVCRSYEKRKCIHITSDPKTIFPWIFLLQFCVQQLFPVTKLISQNQLVGRDWPITLILGFSIFIAFMGLVCYFFVILKFLKTFSTMLKRERKDKLADYFVILRSFSLIILPTSFVSSFILLVGLHYPDLRDTVAVTCLVGTGSNSLIFGCLTTSALKYVRTELSNHVKIFPNTSDDIKLVLKGLTEAYLVIMVMSFLMGTSYFAFCTTYLLRKSSYLFIWLLLSWPPVATVLILTISRISTKIAPSFSVSKSIGKISTIEVLVTSGSGHHATL